MRVLTLAVAGVAVISIMLATGCSSGAPSQNGTQFVPVTRGQVSTEITGVGNLALSNKVDLAFEMDGTVQEVLVSEAHSVSANQVLARLDTTAWEQQVTSLEDAVTAAERNVTAKQRAVTAAERNVDSAQQAVVEAQRNVTSAQRDITSKQYSLLQAQINLKNAQLSLEQTEASSTDPLEIQVKQLQVQLAQGNVDSAQQALDDATANAISDAEQAVEDAQLKVDDAQTAVDDANQAVKDAQKSLQDAQNALTDVQAASPEIMAPFDGFITNVNVIGGDDVKKGTVAMTIADPTKFDAEVMVSEVDILNVQVGGQATVLVEALPGVSFPAEVTQKAPSGTIQSGVVTYKVRVDLTSLQPVSDSGVSAPAASGNLSGGRANRFSQSANGGSASDNATGGFPSGGFSRSGNTTSGNVTPRFPSGGFGNGANMTQEQLDQLRQQMQEARQGQTQGQGSLAAGASSGNAELAEGMTVTVNIITAQSNNTLLVPTQAILVDENGGTFVQVDNNGVTEDRPVTVGISNWEYTEILDGLAEGEQVVVPLSTAPTPTTTAGNFRRNISGGGQSGINQILR
jgi:multidrug efflux pump subunit AcrA (membrane-fusion protein)